MYCMLMLFLVAMPLTQAPGDGYNLAPSAPRQIRTIYWELSDTTEVWVRLVPQVDSGKAAPESLIFYVTFPGRKLVGVPKEVNIRAQVDPLFVAPKFNLKLMPQPGYLLDLTAPGMNYTYTPHCPSGETCAVTGIVSAISFELFGNLVHAKGMTGEILGLIVSFSDPDIDALRAFANGLTQGEGSLTKRK